MSFDRRVWAETGRFRGNLRRPTFCLVQSLFVADVRFWHLADAPLALTNVRFRGKNGHDAGLRPIPLMTQSGHLTQKPPKIRRNVPGAGAGCARRGQKPTFGEPARMSGSCQFQHHLQIGGGGGGEGG